MKTIKLGYSISLSLKIFNKSLKIYGLFPYFVIEFYFFNKQKISQLDIIKVFIIPVFILESYFLVLNHKNV